MIQERASLRARHEQFHDASDYDLVRIDRDYLDRELARCGMAPFYTLEHRYDVRVGRHQVRVDRRVPFASLNVRAAF